jgi:ribose transport system substrate-binding protein
MILVASTLVRVIQPALLSALIIGAAALGSSACKASASTTTSPEAAAPRTCSELPPLPQTNAYRVGFVQVYEPGNRWTEVNTADMLSEAQKHGVQVVYQPPAAAGAKEQIDRMQSLIDGKVDVIVLRPLDTTSLVPSVVSARNACIPVFTVNRLLDPQAVPGRDYVTGITTDSLAQGQMLAEWLVKETQGRAAILEIEGTPGASSAVGRKQGFDERISHEPGMRILASKTANYDRNAGHDVAKELLAAYPKTTAIFAHNDNMALGALAALRELGKTPGKDVIVIGVDGLKEAMEQIVSGALGASVFNDPHFGAVTFATIEKYRVSHMVNPKIIVKGPIIDRTNVGPMLADAF